jgi:hypothetical protein
MQSFLKESCEQVLYGFHVKRQLYIMAGFALELNPGCAKAAKP